FFLFFFQAEDGIRDFHVTGVQTCALPISTDATLRLSLTATHSSSLSVSQSIPSSGPARRSLPSPTPPAIQTDNVELRERPVLPRSEERRVGKECKGRRGTEP